MIYHFKSLVLVRKGRAFYATLYQEVFFANPGGGGSLMLKIVTFAPRGVMVSAGMVYHQLHGMCQVCIKYF